MFKAFLVILSHIKLGIWWRWRQLNSKPKPLILKPFHLIKKIIDPILTHIRFSVLNYLEILFKSEFRICNGVPSITALRAPQNITI